MTKHQVAISNKDKRKLNTRYKEMNWVLIPLRQQVAISCPSSAFSPPSVAFLLVLFHLSPNLLPVPLQLLLLLYGEEGDRNKDASSTHCCKE
jgi:hypothetical protein